MYRMVRGIARNHVGGAVMKFGGIRSSLMGGSVRKWKDPRLWWHGIRCSWLKQMDEPGPAHFLFVLASPVRPVPAREITGNNLGILFYH
jgi:hypothetical protein